MSSDETVDGATVLVRALKTQGVEYIFGIVGIPVIELAGIAQANGLNYIGMRNEQAACYAASVIGYLTKRPAACLTVPGPGLLHTLAGMQNAMENGWPVIIISGSMDMNQEASGSFQELNQVAACRPFVKLSARPSCIERIPFYVEKAVRTSLYGRPGACYIDMPADFIKTQVNANHVLCVSRCPDPPPILSCPHAVQQALDILRNACRPLVVVGKGAAYSRAEDNVRRLVTQLQLPFLPTPMGKGILPDTHHLCVAPARSRALQNADVILLLGARLNWMLHFGQPPRFSPDVKIIQVDLCAEEMHNNIHSCVALQGDVNCVLTQMLAVLDQPSSSFAFDSKSDWWNQLEQKVEQNRKAVEVLTDEPSPPMNYYNSLYELQSLMPRDCVLVCEGSNTMDIARSVLHSYLPRHRVDAGSYGTMGVGCGFAIAAALWCRDSAPAKRVVCIQGDSAFGFSGMEVETACRYSLPVIFVVINNNGIAFGMDAESFSSAKATADPLLTLLPTALTPGARYEQLMSAFGGKGYRAETRNELREAFLACLADSSSASLINVIISPTAGKKPQEFHWLTSKM